MSICCTGLLLLVTPFCELGKEASAGEELLIKVVHGEEGDEEELEV